MINDIASGFFLAALLKSHEEEPHEGLSSLLDKFFGRHWTEVHTWPKSEIHAN